MRLDEGVIRELHWHKEAEWAYVLEGNVRVTALDMEGGNFIDDLEKGDLWYFPAGHPHSLQGLSPNGTEFLLIFDDGSFSEESTFLLTDWLGKRLRARPAETSHVYLEQQLNLFCSTHTQSRSLGELPIGSRSLRRHPAKREIYLPGLCA